MLFKNFPCYNQERNKELPKYMGGFRNEKKST